MPNEINRSKKIFRKQLPLNVVVTSRDVNSNKSLQQATLDAIFPVGIVGIMGICG